MILINSKDNKTIKLYVKLQSDKKYRDSTGYFVVESAKIIKHMLDNNIKPASILITKNFMEKNPHVVSFLQTCENSFLINESIANKISMYPSHQGVFGIFFKPKEKKLNFKKDGCYLILDGLQDVTNIANIVRTAMAFNIDGIVISNDSVDVFNPKVIRYSMGAILGVNFYYTSSIKDVIKLMHDKQIKVYAASLSKNSKSISDINIKQSVAIILGNEGSGIKKHVLNEVDGMIKIPFNGNIDSLNVANAAAIVLWEMKK